jgi:transposase
MILRSSLRGAVPKVSIVWLARNTEKWLNLFMSRHPRNIVFKPYEQNQLQLFPRNIGDLIPEGHLVRLVNYAIDRMNIDFLIDTYKGGGTSSYHPRMLLKILVYAYIQGIYTSRQIAKAIRENIHFMWLAGENRPDFRTINRFRSSRLKGEIDRVFMLIMEMLIEAGYVHLRDYFVDGTKIEANANKYSYVWKKSVQHYKKQLQEKLKLLLAEIEETNEAENRHYGDRDLAELGEDSPLTSEQLEEKLAELEARLNKDKDNKKLGKTVKQIKDDYLPRQRKYEDQERKLGKRNSYSKTDEDATFMRRKEDAMKNSQLRAAYNIQLGTEGQFIVGYSVHQNPGDSGLFIPHLERVKEFYKKLPHRIIADSAYGSEENYEYMENNGLTGFVKYNTFHKEKTRAYKSDRFRTDNLEYDAHSDSYVCPAGKPLKYTHNKEVVTANGYKSSRRVYEAEDCSGCSLRSKCLKGKGNRRIEVNPRLISYRQRARELLESKEGKRLRSLRCVEVESVFGQIKHNGHFRRFHLRGLEKVQIELGLIAIAHNMKKWYQKELEKRVDNAFYCIKYFSEILGSYFSLFFRKQIWPQLG